MDMENQLWDLSIRRFWYLGQVLELISHGYQGTTVNVKDLDKTHIDEKLYKLAKHNE